jgi:hypothetical protein
MIRSTELAEINIQALPGISQDPCKYCVGEDVLELEEHLTEQYNTENPDDRLTVGDLNDHEFVWIACNANQYHLVHLSDECPHMKEANKPDRRKAYTMHDDRGLCKRCTDGWIKQGHKGEYNNLAARLKASDNPEELLNSD